MFICTMRRTAAFFILISFLVTPLTGCAGVAVWAADTADGTFSSNHVIILDAGHGGEDCGAIGTSGVLEKDLNFAVAQQLGQILTERGYTVIQTRTEDKLLYKEHENIKGMRKISDLKNRHFISESYPDGILVSIHMNVFSQSKYSGLQIWSADDAGSCRLAELLQNKVCATLQPENHRRAKKGASSMFLLRDNTHEAILIECGFLSNPAECARLEDESYRKELSTVLACGIIEYLKEKDAATP